MMFGRQQHLHQQQQLNRIEAALVRIEARQTYDKYALERIMTSVADVQASVTAEDTVITSAVTLLQGLSAALAAAGTDPAALAALKTDIDTNTAALAAAIVANTLGAPPPNVALQKAVAAAA